MKTARGFLALGLLFTCQLDVRAQFVVPALLPGYSAWGGVRFSYSRRGLSVAGTFGNPYLGWGLSPFAPYGGFAPYGIPSTRVSVYYSPPPVVVSPPIVIQQPVVVRERNVDVTEDAEFVRIVPRANKLAPAEREAMAAPLPMPGVPRGNFRPIQPKDRVRAEKPVPALPAPKRADGGRQTRSGELLAEGKAAFLQHLHGRAERLFAAASKAAPADPTAPFFVAQARFALRKYREAVEAIESGLRTLPTWPSRPFRADELYGANGADFQSHLRHLEETLARNPNDPALLFLYGYELWFSGRRAEARTMFERAAKVTPDRASIDLFLKAQPAEPMARRP